MRTFHLENSQILIIAMLKCQILNKFACINNLKNRIHSVCASMLLLFHTVQPQEIVIYVCATCAANQG